MKMKEIFAALFATALLCGALLAQNTPSSATQPNSASPSAEPAQQSAPQQQSQPQSATPASTPKNDGAAQAANPLKIAPGSVIPVQLAKTVDAKKAKTGDEVVATVTQDMKSDSGDVLVPKDTKIVGHVTEAQARNKEQKESQLGITFDHAVVKGDQMPLPMSIQAIIAPPTNSPNAPAGGDTPASPSATATSPMGGGRSTAATPSTSGQNAPPAGGASDSQPQTAERPPITGNTQGVIGMPDMKLENNAQNAAQGSVVTSEKNNVKIEKGTFMLLRVNQAGQQ